MAGVLALGINRRTPPQNRYAVLTLPQGEGWVVVLQPLALP